MLMPVRRQLLYLAAFVAIASMLVGMVLFSRWTQREYLGINDLERRHNAELQILNGRLQEAEAIIAEQTNALGDIWTALGRLDKR